MVASSSKRACSRPLADIDRVHVDLDLTTAELALIAITVSEGGQPLAMGRTSSAPKQTALCRGWQVKLDSPPGAYVNLFLHDL